MSQAYLQVIAHYVSQEGNAERVCELLQELALATRTEPKNLYYDFFRSPTEPNHFVILEQYSDANGLAEHRDTAHFKELGLGAIIPLLEKREVKSHMVQQ